MKRPTWDELEHMMRTQAHHVISELTFDQLWYLISHTKEGLGEQSLTVREFIRDRFADIASARGNGMDLCNGTSLYVSKGNSYDGLGTKNHGSYTYKLRKAAGYTYP